MPSYLVRWEIDIDARTPRAAAKEALEIQRDPSSIATCFDVVSEDGRTTTFVDLMEDPSTDYER